MRFLLCLSFSSRQGEWENDYGVGFCQKEWRITVCRDSNRDSDSFGAIQSPLHFSSLLWSCVAKLRLYSETSLLRSRGWMEANGSTTSLSHLPLSIVHRLWLCLCVLPASPLTLNTFSLLSLSRFNQIYDDEVACRFSKLATMAWQSMGRIFCLHKTCLQSTKAFGANLTSQLRYGAAVYFESQQVSLTEQVSKVVNCEVWYRVTEKQVNNELWLDGQGSTFLDFFEKIHKQKQWG